MEDEAKTFTAKELNDVLGEWHAEMFGLCGDLERAGDQRGAAAAFYLHDRFCLVRHKILGYEAGPMTKFEYAPHPLSKPNLQSETV